MNFSKLSKKDFEDIYHKVPRAGVDIVIKNENGILLAKRAIEPFKGMWNLPGTGVLFRESINQAIDRLADEELGVEVKIIKPIGMIEYLNDGARHTISNVYLVEIVSGELKNSIQSNDINFFKTIPDKTNPYEKEFLNNNLDQIIA